MPQTSESNIQYTFLKEQITLKNAELNVLKYKYTVQTYDAEKCILGTDREKIWPDICKDTHITDAGQNMTFIKDERGNISFYPLV